VLKWEAQPIRAGCFRPAKDKGRQLAMGKAVILWLVGVPIPVIILLFACHVIH
jgi:hypothetical protein